MLEPCAGRGVFLRALRWSTAILCLYSLSLGSALAERPEPPPFYAIRDARVVTGTGEVLERADLLIADGLIEAVGTDLEIPGDAWGVDGEGLTVYPGLIDAMGGTGLAQSSDEDSEGGRGQAPQRRGPEDRPATTPWVDGADHLDPEAKLDGWRQAGFTAALASPGEGFFPGQAVLIDLSEDEPQDRVLASGVAHRIGFDGGSGFRGYPASLMGGIAYVEQVLLDARHEEVAHTLYERSPKGRERPRYDRALAPLRRALESQAMFLIPAVQAHEIDRALRLAEEYELQAALFGGHGAYDRIDALKRSKTPVLVNLDWPEASKDRDPDARTNLRTLIHREMAPRTPHLLHDAGVPFAFSSDGLSSPSEFFEGVRTAVEAGLSNEGALEALTLGAARILGVDDRLGSITAGKIANLVVATAEPWSEDTEVKAVFVDGELFQEREEVEDFEPPNGDVSGTWAMTLTTPRGNRDMEAVLEMDAEGKVSGDISSERGDSTVEKGRLSADQLTFETSRTMGSRTVEVSWSLALEGERLEGTMSAGPMVMDVSGERTAKAEAKPADAEGEAEEDTVVPTDELMQAMATMEGPVRTLGSFAITGAKVYTGTGEVIDNGTVVVRDGKIAAVGADVEVPSGVETIDAQGGSLIPGIIDAHSHIAVDGGVNEGTLVVSSMVTIEDVVDPTDIAIYRALAGGVTSINVLHGSANPIGGGNAVLKLRWGSDAEGLRFDGAPPGIKFALGENPKRSRSAGRGTPRYPVTRMGVMDVIRQAFLEAQDYRQAWEDYEAAEKAGQKPTPPRRDLKLEPLVEILEGKRLVHSHCYRADEILQLLRLAEEFGFKIATLQHVLEGYKVADEIAAHGAGASTFSDWWGFKVEAYEAIPHNAALMTERGVVVSINSDSGEEMRHLNQEAAKAIRWGGLDEHEALKLVTLNPAIHLGIDDRVGSIEVGKDADLALYDGHPLSVFSVVQKTFVDGDLYFDIEADRERQAAIDAMQERLEPKDDESEETADGEGGDGDGDSDSTEPEWQRITDHDMLEALSMHLHGAHSCREDAH